VGAGAGWELHGSLDEVLSLLLLLLLLVLVLVLVLLVPYRTLRLGGALEMLQILHDVCMCSMYVVCALHAIDAPTRWSRLSTGCVCVSVALRRCSALCPNHCHMRTSLPRRLGGRPGKRVGGQGSEEGGPACLDRRRQPWCARPDGAGIAYYALSAPWL